MKPYNLGTSTNPAISPFLFHHNVTALTDDENEKIAQHAIEQFQNKIDGTRHNSVLVDHTPEIDKLSNIFYDICEDWFDNIERQIENISTHQIWAYVQTKDEFVSEWHSHVTQCTINGVYYASVPDPTGTLSYINVVGEIETVTPKERELLIFPGWMIHKPNPQQDSNDYRVAINIEYLSLKRPILSPDKFSYDQYCRFTNNNFPKAVVW
jgi:hypothetical protein